MNEGQKNRAHGTFFFCATISIFVAVSNNSALSQTVSNPDLANDDSIAAKTILDPSPFISARAAGMGGAFATSADDVDAIYYNPAGIGGFGWTDTTAPTIKKLYFPFFGFGANTNASNLHKEFQAEGAADSAALGSAVIDAHAGQRQYGRATMGLGLVSGRAIVFPFYDQQLAAVGKGESTDLVDLNYRALGGVAYGMSFADKEQRFSLGVSGHTGSLTVINGETEYQSMINPEKRAEALKVLEKKYSGSSLNLGLLWRMGKSRAVPTLAVVIRNSGDTHYKPSSSSATEDIIIPQDATVGFSLSPRFGRYTQLNWSIEGGNLTDEKTTLRKKLKTSLEVLLGSNPGSYSLFGTRLGYNHAGFSGGLSMNLGILMFECSTTAVDIGYDNNRLIERRLAASVAVNVADF